MKTEKPVFRNFFIDEVGNKLHIKHTDKRVFVSLELVSENRKRNIGAVTKSTKTLFIKRNRAEHLFRKGNAYGFNEYVLLHQTSFEYISLFDGIDNWKIPITFILENGKCLHFNQKGLEKQLFVSLQQLEKFKILESEKRRI